MARILEHWRILGATLFSLVLIGSAVFIARDAQSPRSARASAESELLKAIATKDTDGDGLPDWEESLYGADPNKVDTFGLGMPDGQAVARGLVVPRAVAEYEIQTSSSVPKTPGIDDSIPPPPAEGTLTAIFAQNIYSAYRMARETKGADLSGAEISTVVQEALRAFSSSIKPSPDFKTSSELTSIGSSQESLRAYAVAVDAILKKNTATAEKTGLEYLQEVVEGNNDEALIPLVSLARAYRETAVGIAELPVPTKLSGEGLRLINVFMRLSELTANFAQVRVDPLATMLALEQYSDAILAFAYTLMDISAIYKVEGIIFDSNTPGSSFVNMIADIAEKQAARK